MEGEVKSGGHEDKSLQAEVTDTKAWRWGGKERGEDCIFSRCLNIPVISAFYSIINTSVPIPRIDANVSKSKDQVDVPDKPRLLN